MPEFCDVAVPVPLDATFTYGIPEDSPQPVVGGRVIVPFREQRLSGIVTELHDRKPEFAVKRLSQILDTTPALTPDLMQLGRWIAQYYIAPIGEVLRTMLPLSAEFRRVIGYRITDKGIDALQKVTDVNLLSIPDAAPNGGNFPFHVADTQDIQSYMVAHCEKMKDRFAILDCTEVSATTTDFSALVTQRQGLSSSNGYGAFYFPWIAISNPFGSGRIFVPPSGHLGGVYANSDNNFGVFRAPANEQITTALATEVVVTDDMQGPWNDIGINVIRSFPNEGVLIWGARTIAPPDITAWRFVNVRRLTTFIEKSIQEGTRFAVFLPNNLQLWQQIKRLVTSFLTDQWTEGALFGDTAALAFRVQVDEAINPPSIRALGQLVVQVTIVPTTPAEFIVFQVIQDITGATLQEASST